MKLHTLYSAPHRIYLCFLLLGITGFLCYQTLPISLFPNSTRPQIGSEVPYGNLTRDGFLTSYGKDIEQLLHAIRGKSCTADRVEAQYSHKSVYYNIQFGWGDEGAECLKEVRQVISTFQSQWPGEVQRRLGVWQNSSGTGFFLASLHSKTRSDVAIHTALEPILRTKFAGIREVERVWLNDPAAKQITIELSPAKLAAFKLRPKEVVEKIQQTMTHYNGGEVHVGTNQLSLEIGTPLTDVKELGSLLVTKTTEKKIYLSEIAHIKVEPATKERNLTTLNGSSSVLIFSKPAPGKNIRDMSRKIIAALENTLKKDPQFSDIDYTVMVNPGAFVDQSISNVLKEVGICSLIAVLILFLFIGTFSGTVPALIEIPLSLLLSFILMKLAGVHINMISLGGLALSVGMNVDASIVVIDSILKRFSLLKGTRLSKNAIVSSVVEAVQEVYIPVVLSTITSLIVFIPLSFTSDLTEAILGDLAKTVIFSHGLSLFIALLLVPSIRVHMAYRFGITSEHHALPWLERIWNSLYTGYESSLSWLLEQRKTQWILYAGVLATLVAAVTWIPSQLKREIIGIPETAIIGSQIQVYQSSTHQQTQSYIAKFEQQIREKWGDKIDFTFAEVYQKDRSAFWISLRDKSEAKAMQESLEEMAKSRLDATFDFYPFNPAELPLPNPPDWEITFHGRHSQEIRAVREAFRVELLDRGILTNLPDPQSAFPTQANLIPIPAAWAHLSSNKANDLTPSDIGQMILLGTDPIEIGLFTLQEKQLPLVAAYPHQTLTSIADMEALPIFVGEKIIPLRALMRVKLESNRISNLYRVDGDDTYTYSGNFTEKEKRQEKTLRRKLSEFIGTFQAQQRNNGVVLTPEDTQKELTQALHELLLAIAISLGLIFLVLYLQFSSLVHTLIIMLAIPFGLIGVFLSLYIFHSTLSVNAALGIILLIGITVANSIMLVEKILHLHRAGTASREAILETAKKRIRPILMTSLTTILGMLPIAIGAGDGGKILQPLGIAVCGGLWISLLFTLYLVPTLEYAYLRRTDMK